MQMHIPQISEMEGRWGIDYPSIKGENKVRAVARALWRLYTGKVPKKLHESKN